jgi:hypothetical protein
MLIQKFVTKKGNGRNQDQKMTEDNTRHPMVIAIQ